MSTVSHLVRPVPGLTLRKDRERRVEGPLTAEHRAARVVEPQVDEDRKAIDPAAVQVGGRIEVIASRGMTVGRAVVDDILQFSIPVMFIN